jgi:hypothetical protein
VGRAVLKARQILLAAAQTMQLSVSHCTGLLLSTPRNMKTPVSTVAFRRHNSTAKKMPMCPTNMPLIHGSYMTIQQNHPVASAG